MKSMESSAAISADSLTTKEKTTENLSVRAQDDMPTMREKICYGFGDVSCNIVYGLVASLITLFYTDYVGVPAMTVGLVMIISRCLDGVSDFVMGVIVSKTNSKWGKARPWILWMAVPFGVAAVLLMMVPQTTPMLVHPCHIQSGDNGSVHRCKPAVWHDVRNDDAFFPRT